MHLLSVLDQTKQPSRLLLEAQVLRARMAPDAWAGCAERSGWASYVHKFQKASSYLPLLIFEKQTLNASSISLELSPDLAGYKHEVKCTQNNKHMHF